MTYNGATTISLISPGLSSWVGSSFDLVTSENTATSRSFDSSINTQFEGVQINSDNRIYVNEGNDTGNPVGVRIGTSGSWSTDVALVVGDTIQFTYDNTNVLASWVVTSSHLWSTSGGTGTEGSTAVTSGAFDLDASGQLTAFIPASTPSGTYSIVEDGVTRNSFTHTVLTASFEPATGWSSGNTSVWTLEDSYGTVLDTYFSAKKKVHCNFW